MGHSQGASAVLAGLSTKLDLQQFVNRFYAMAPVAYFKGIDQKDTIYFYLASHHYVKILNFLGIHKLAERTFNRTWLERLALKIFCN